MLNTFTTNEEEKIFSKYEFWRGHFNLNNEVGSCSACGSCSPSEVTSSCAGGGCSSCKGCGRD